MREPKGKERLSFGDLERLISYLRSGPGKNMTMLEEVIKAREQKSFLQIVEKETKKERR